MKKIILWLYSSPENKYGRSPLGFTKKTIIVSFVVALVVCIASGDLLMLTLYGRADERLTNKLKIDVNVSSADTSLIKRIEAFIERNVGSIENEQVFAPLFDGKSVNFASFSNFLGQRVDIAQLKREILGKYKMFPLFSLDPPNTISICEHLGYTRPPSQIIKKLTTDDIKFYAAFKVIDEFRNQLKNGYGEPLRLIICFAGLIQWLTFISAVFGSLLLIFRIYMVRLQTILISTGKLNNNLNESIWDEDSRVSEPLSRKLGEIYPGLLLPVIIIQATKHSISKALFFDDKKNLIRDEVTALRNKTESDYTLTDFLNFVSPSLGFLGTIVGIILAFGWTKSLLSSSDNFSRLIAFDNITFALATAFDTTAVGLVCSLILNYLTTRAKASESQLYETLEKTSIIQLTKS